MPRQVISSTQASTHSSPCTTLLTILSNQEGEALAPRCIHNKSNSWVRVENAVRSTVSGSATTTWMESREEIEDGDRFAFVEEVRNTASAGTGLSVEAGEGVEVLRCYYRGHTHGRVPAMYVIETKAPVPPRELARWGCVRSETIQLLSENGECPVVPNSVKDGGWGHGRRVLLFINGEHLAATGLCQRGE